MLSITIPEQELYDAEHNLFTQSPKTILRLEHSLVSLSKWESTFCKPFLTKENKTTYETVSYVECMTLTQNVDPSVYVLLNKNNFDLVSQYIDASMTATILPKQNTINRETITSELIYFWMISFSIPFECQKWHLNRLLTLINVCNIKNQPKKKINQRDLRNRNRALNEARKAKYNTSG